MSQKPMSKIAFTMMQLIMSFRRGGKKIIESEIAAAELQRGETVLDYGCGPGYNTIFAAQKVGSSGKVVALDVTSQALDVVRKKATAQNLDNITTKLSDCDTGLENASVDVVFLHNVLPMTERPQDILREISRVLKPGGRLSYKSGGGARMAANNMMSDAEIGKILEHTHGFSILSRKNDHTVFIKNVMQSISSNN